MVLEGICVCSLTVVGHRGLECWGNKRGVRGWLRVRPLDRTVAVAAIAAVGAHVIAWVLIVGGVVGVWLLHIVHRRVLCEFRVRSPRGVAAGIWSLVLYGVHHGVVVVAALVVRLVAVVGVVVVAVVGVVWHHVLVDGVGLGVIIRGPWGWRSMGAIIRFRRLVWLAIILIGETSEVIFVSAGAHAVRASVWVVRRLVRVWRGLLEVLRNLVEKTNEMCYVILCGHLILHEMGA